MFNWIPQGDEEQQAADPLMTLPRFWSTDLDVVGALLGASNLVHLVVGHSQIAQ
jgi:hypothetical protein